MFSTENKAGPHLTNNKTWTQSEAAATTCRLLTLQSHPTAGGAQSPCVICRLCIQSSAWLLPGTSYSEQVFCVKGQVDFWPKCNPASILKVGHCRKLPRNHTPLSMSMRSAPFSAAIWIHHSMGHREIFLCCCLGATPVAEKGYWEGKWISQIISNMKLLRFLTALVESSRVGTGTWTYRNTSAPAFLQMCNKLLIQNNDVARTVISNE